MRSLTYLGRYLPLSIAFTTLLAPVQVASIPSAVFASNIFRGLKSLIVHEQSTLYVHAEEIALPTNFWERAATLGDLAQKYAEMLIDQTIAENGPVIGSKIANVQASMSHIVKSAAAIRSEMYATAEVNEEGINNIGNAIEKVLMDLYEDLKRAFPPPDHAPSHAERVGNVTMVLKRAEEAIIRVGVDHGVSEPKLREHLDQLLPYIQNVVVTIGDLAEQHPDLLEALLISSALMFIPEGWLLRPLLSLFGFGPYGPVKGSSAAWAQRVFYGAAVSKGSWFSHLQRAGMKFISLPVKKGIFGGIFGLIGLAGSIFAGCGRRQ